MRQAVTQDTSQYIDNKSFDETYQTTVVIPLQSDGTYLRYPQTDLVAMKVTESGDNTYVAIAPIGTAQATAGWQAKKIAISGGDTVITWADGNASFDNVATDLTSLSYS
jgi:hypothetical protein